MKRAARRGSALVVSLDVGTSSVRATLYDARGRLLPGAEVAIAYVPRITHDGGVEADADWLLELTASAVDRALRLVPRGRSIAGVAVSTFWHSLLGVSPHRRTVTPLLLWADTRSAPHIAELRRRLARGSRSDEATAVREYHQRTGAPLHVSFWPSKLLWLATVQPRQYQRVKRWMSFGEYLYLNLFGEALCSMSMASATGLWNQAAANWDDAALVAAGVAASAMNAVSDEAQQGLHAPWAERWPALSAVPWRPAWGDGACANVGSGAIGARQMALTVGTSSALRAVVPAQAHYDLPDSLWRYAIDRRRSLIGGALSEGGNIYRWALDTLRLAAAAAETRAERQVRRARHPGRTPARALAEKSPEQASVPAAQLSSAELRRLTRMLPDQHGLTLLPFFAGERSPGWRPEARASIAGLRLATTPLELLRAAMESVALRLAAIHDDLYHLLGSPNSDWEILAGGAALRHSPLWVQIIADALGSSITTSGVEESSARGAALLAWEGLGERPIEQAPVPRGKIHQPAAQFAPAYAQARRRQTALYDALRGSLETP